MHVPKLLTSRENKIPKLLLGSSKRILNLNGNSTSSSDILYGGSKRSVSLCRTQFYAFACALSRRQRRGNPACMEQRENDVVWGA
jgi:hypothetical protein